VLRLAMAMKTRWKLRIPIALVGVIALLWVAFLEIVSYQLRTFKIDTHPSRDAKNIEYALKLVDWIVRHRSIGSDQLVRPGIRVGPLKLGDSREHAIGILPRNTQRDAWPNVSCGTEYLWVDAGSPKVGTVSLHFADGLVFQIDSATTRFQTAEGITAYDSPNKVKEHYKGLRAYLLSNYTTMAIGNRPLIYWVDRKNGIAFAYSRTEQLRYLYKIIVFKPDSDICGKDGTTNSPDRRELAPYSLEPPDAMAANRPSKMSKDWLTAT
jgi:hypothetical protein